MQDAAPLEGQLLDAVNKDFGSLDKLKETMNAQLAGIQVCCTAVMPEIWPPGACRVVAAH